jgi:hypothetical protein
VVWCGVVRRGGKPSLSWFMWPSSQLQFLATVQSPPVISDAYRRWQGGRPGCGVGGEVIDPAMTVPRRLLFL